MGTRKPWEDRADEQPRRKRLRIRPEAIAAARTALGTRSDSETIERALVQVIAWDTAWKTG